MTLHACNNRRAFLHALVVQDGWDWLTVLLPGGEQRRTRTPRMVAVPFRMSEECQYVPVGGPDPRCEGCRWRRDVP